MADNEALEHRPVDVSELVRINVDAVGQRRQAALGRDRDEILTSRYPGRGFEMPLPTPFEAKWLAAARAITEQRGAKQYALSLTLYRCEVAAQRLKKLVLRELKPMIGIRRRRLRRIIVPVRRADQQQPIRSQRALYLLQKAIVLAKMLKRSNETTTLPLPSATGIASASPSR
jgi:hypothetical protein